MAVTPIPPADLPAELARMEAYCEAAKPGHDEANVQFLARAGTDLPRLLATVRGLVEEVDSLRAQMPTDPAHQDCVVILRSAWHALGVELVRVREERDALRAALGVLREAKIAPSQDRYTVKED